ncbi:MAG: hypothetical protein IAE78_23080 [Myxococcus sp.]|nr:hypothetical protein [Myxococcus sp.]
MEAMASEGLVAAAWEFEGLLTRVRWPIKVPSGYSDVDVIGVDAAGRVRFGECKVRGPARRVLVGETNFGDWLGDWAGFLGNIKPLVGDQRPAWIPKPEQISQLEIWFCGNVWFRSAGERAAAEDDLAELARKSCPKELRPRVQARIRSTSDLLFGLIRDVRRRVIDEEHGKRFGHPLVDSIRELVRFLNPKPTNGGRVSDQIAEDTRRELLAAFGIK